MVRKLGMIVLYNVTDNANVLCVASWHAVTEQTACAGGHLAPEYRRRSG